MFRHTFISQYQWFNGLLRWGKNNNCRDQQGNGYKDLFFTYHRNITNNIIRSTIMLFIRRFTQRSHRHLKTQHNASLTYFKLYSFCPIYLFARSGQPVCGSVVKSALFCNLFREIRWSFINCRWIIYPGLCCIHCFVFSLTRDIHVSGFYNKRDLQISL